MREITKALPMYLNMNPDGSFTMVHRVVEEEEVMPENEATFVLKFQTKVDKNGMVHVGENTVISASLYIATLTKNGWIVERVGDTIYMSKPV